jgi:hypothetical protein
MKKMVPILMGTLYQFGTHMLMYVQCQLSSIPLIVFVQRFPKAKRFKKKGWPLYFVVQAMIPTVEVFTQAPLFLAFLVGITRNSPGICQDSYQE